MRTCRQSFARTRQVEHFSSGACSFIESQQRDGEADQCAIQVRLDALAACGQFGERARNGAAG
jgi:hypothetical protein